MGEVIRPDFGQEQFIEPDTLLEDAKGALTDAIIIGMDNDGDFYMTHSSEDVARLLLMLEVAKNDLTRGVEKDLGLVE
jgi:hypothetical protein